MIFRRNQFQPGGAVAEFPQKFPLRHKVGGGFDFDGSELLLREREKFDIPYHDGGRRFALHVGIHPRGSVGGHVEDAGDPLPGFGKFRDIPAAAVLLRLRFR